MKKKPIFFMVQLNFLNKPLFKVCLLTIIYSKNLGSKSTCPRYAFSMGTFVCKVSQILSVPKGELSWKLRFQKMATSSCIFFFTGNYVVTFKTGDGSYDWGGIDKAGTDSTITLKLTGKMLLWAPESVPTD